MSTMTEKDKSELLQAMKKDESFKKEVITAIVTDKAFISILTKAVLSQPVNEVGIMSNGTIAEWFLRSRKTGY